MGEAKQADAQWDAVVEATELLVAGRHHDAVMALGEVVRDDPRNPYAFHYLGVAFYELAEYDAARDAYGAAIALSPEYLGARYGLSCTLRRLGDARGAYRAANDMLEQAPGDSDATYAVAMALAALGRRREAAEWLEKFLALGPELEVGLEVRGVLDLLAQGSEGEPFDLG